MASRQLHRDVLPHNVIRNGSVIAVMAGGFCGAVRACVGSGCSLQADEAKDVTYGGEVREVSMPAPEPAPSPEPSPEP